MIGEWLEIAKLVGAVLGIIGGILSPIITVAVFYFRKSFVSHDGLKTVITELDGKLTTKVEDYREARSIEIVNLDKRVTRHSERLLQVENDIRHVPKKSELYEVRESLTKLTGKHAETTASLAATTKALTSQMDRIEYFLRNQKS